jgi:GNAT superfamily N-acetyltransferase
MNGAQKVPRFSLIPLTNQDPDFYPTVGPFLSRRAIVAELGHPVWDDDDKQWIAAVSEDGETFGIVGRRGADVCSLYVDPDRRGLLVGAALLNAAADVDEPLRATVTESAVDLFTDLGFTPTGSRGRYTTMTRKGRRVLPK